MEINLYLLLSLLIALLVISYLLGKLHRVRGQLFLIRDALNDIKAGNGICGGSEHSGVRQGSAKRSGARD